MWCVKIYKLSDTRDVAVFEAKLKHGGIDKLLTCKDNSILSILLCTMIFYTGWNVFLFSFHAKEHVSRTLYIALEKHTEFYKKQYIKVERN